MTVIVTQGRSSYRFLMIVIVTCGRSAPGLVWEDDSYCNARATIL